MSQPKHGHATWSQGGFKKLLSVEFLSSVDKQLDSIMDKIDTNLKKIDKTAELKDKKKKLYETYKNLGAFFEKIKYPGFNRNSN